MSEKKVQLQRGQVLALSFIIQEMSKAEQLFHSRTGVILADLGIDPALAPYVSWQTSPDLVGTVTVPVEDTPAVAPAGFDAPEAPKAAE